MAITVIDIIKAKNAGSFPVVEDIDQLGGLRVVANITARDAIPSSKRKEGMWVVVVSDGKTYNLIGGVGNANWVEKVFGGGVTVYATEVALLAAIPANSTIGYATDTNTFWYRRAGAWSKASSTEIVTLSGGQTISGNKIFTGGVDFPGAGTNSESIGTSSAAYSNYGVAVGYNATISVSGDNSSPNSIAVGWGSRVARYCNNGIAIGSGANVGNTTSPANGSIAIGQAALAYGPNNVVVGQGSNIYNPLSNYCVVVGSSSSVAGGSKNTLVGYGNLNNGAGDDVTLIGYNNQISSAFAKVTAVGSFCYLNGAESIAIGCTPIVYSYGVAVGNNTNSQSYGTSVGTGAQSQSYGVAVGAASNCRTSGLQYGTAVGYSSAALTTGAVAVGANSNVRYNFTYQSSYAIAIGYSANVHENSPYSVVIGYQAVADDGGVFNNTSSSVVIGYSAQSKGASAIAIGRDAHADYANSLAIGEGATPTANNKGEIGSASKLIDLNINGKLSMTGDTFKVATSRTITNAGDPGNTGEVCWDSNFVYVCVAGSTWKRAALSTWP